MVFCLLGASFSFWMFWNDLNRTMERFADPMGTITYKKQTAQRRYANRTLWTRLSQGAPVYMNDYIRTAGFSEAVVHFNGGATMDLAENSLVQIRIEKGRTIIDLSAGDVSVAPGEEGEVRILGAGKDSITVEPKAVVHASLGDSGTFTMEVLEGSAAVNGQMINAGESFSTRPAEERAAPLSPRGNSYFLAGEEGAEVLFSWSRQNYSGPSRLDLGLDRRFNKLEQSLIREADALPRTFVSLSLRPGVYWWRVYPDGGRIPQTPAGKFTVLSPLIPELIQPGAGYTFYEAGTETEIRFLWKAAPRTTEPVGDYTLEIADTPEFKSPRLSVKVPAARDAALSYRGLEPGIWYWRVWEDFPGLRRPEAKSSFTISPEAPPVPAAAPAAAPAAVPTAAASPAIPAAPPMPRVSAAPRNPPELTGLPAEAPALLALPRNMDPPDRFTVGPDLLRRRRRISFGWDEVPGANSYIFTIVRESGGEQQLVLRTEIPHPPFTLEDFSLLDRGTFTWQVEGIRRRGDVIQQRGESGKARFIVDFPEPKNPRVADPGVLYGR
ncbi:MAG: hypothetical protein LBE14_00480 [Treponema sp.]|nr:hypothetical protein [Treponema sp.]